MSGCHVARNQWLGTILPGHLTCTAVPVSGQLDRCCTEGLDKASRGGQGEYEPIKILYENLAYILKQI
jgi:hypothetical protein